ncbi:serine/threonine-protein kinase [Streptosporangium amethystogenes]|uniref:serine/threonine-protein kinase n=1 Tax=Streptosporangium amethystogenes TaxID=2002 RepID=UPI003787E682
MTGPREPGFKGPGRVGDYRVLRPLGEGGQGVVHLGESPGGALVAIKVLHARFAANPEIRRRFLREAEIAASVAAFCTARVIGTGMADEQPYIVSEYVSGPSLDALVRSGGPRIGSGLERLAVSTLTALASIHRAGIVHRDFKPSNVILGPEGPVVIDFGIARAVDHMTSSTDLAGTPAYMSPEQLTDESLTPASDMFSWASTMIFAATGRAAFPASSVPAILHAVLNSEPDVSGVPQPLRSLVAACLAKDPAARPAADRLLRDLTGETIGGPVPGGPRPVPRQVPQPAPLRANAHPEGRTLVDLAAPAGRGLPAGARYRPEPGPTSPSAGLAPRAPAGRRLRWPVLAVAAAATALAVTAGVILVPSWIGEQKAVGSSEVSTPPKAKGPLDPEAFPKVDVADRFADNAPERYAAHRPSGDEAVPAISVGSGRFVGSGSEPFFGIIGGPGTPSSDKAVSVLTADTFAGTEQPEDSVFVGWVKDGDNYVTAWYNHTRKASGINVRVNGGFLETHGEVPLTLEGGDRFALMLSGGTITSFAENDGVWRTLNTATIGDVLATPQARQQYRYAFGLRGSTGSISVAGLEGRSAAG